ARETVKRTLKEKHISQTEMCDRVQWTIEWLKMVCITVVLPALFVCLKEEQMTKIIKGISTELTNDQPQKSTKVASLIGECIFVTMMQCLRNKMSYFMSEAKCSLENVMTSEHSIEMILMFKKDLINCVYLELLANGMGKNFPVDDMENNSQARPFKLRWEFFMSVLHYFCQWASWHHMESFLELPHTLQDDLGGSMTKAERTTLNVLTKKLTDTVTDMIGEATEHPFWVAEMMKQGSASLTNDADVESSCSEETPDSEVFSPSTKTETTGGP
ncbi:hypothetical protein IRJ41_008358, partial [Triplophysa rosa]